MSSPKLMADDLVVMETWQKISLPKLWKCDAEFLNLFAAAELVKLAKEWKVATPPAWDSATKKWKVDWLLAAANKSKCKAPKILAEAKKVR